MFMHTVEAGTNHDIAVDNLNNPPNRIGILESMMRFLKDWEDPDFILQTLDRLGEHYPHQKKNLEREIRQRIPKKSDITAGSLGIYLTSRAFDQIEAGENRDVDDMQINQYVRPEDKNPIPNLSQLLSEINLKDIPVQPTVEEYAGVEEETTIESVQRLKERVGRLWDDPIRSAATRKKMSDAKKRHWQNPEYYRKMVESRKREWETRKAGIRKYETVVVQSVAGTEIVTFDYYVDKEDRSLWMYALQEGILEKIIESGKLSEAEIEILTQYFNLKGKVSNISVLLDRFSIALAQLA